MKSAFFISWVIFFIIATTLLIVIIYKLTLDLQALEIKAKEVNYLLTLMGIDIKKPIRIGDTTYVPAGLWRQVPCISHDILDPLCWEKVEQIK